MAGDFEHYQDFENSTNCLLLPLYTTKSNASSIYQFLIILAPTTLCVVVHFRLLCFSAKEPIFFYRFNSRF